MKKPAQIGPPDVTFVLCRDGKEIRRVQVDSSRFSIGRGPDSDLYIDDKSLSRQHVLVESSGSRVQLSDWDSLNGTAVNGKLIRGVVSLQNGDLIEIGNGITLRVEWSGAESLQNSVTKGRGERIMRSGQDLSPEGRSNRPAGHSTKPASSLPLLAIMAATLVIGLFTITLMWRRNQARPGDTSGVVESAGHSSADNGSSEEDQRESTSVSASSSQDLTGLTEKAAVQLIRQISNDPQPYTFPAGALDDINSQITSYRGSKEVADAIRQLAPHCQEIARQSRPMIEPALPLYAGLADTIVRKTSNNPTEAAERSLPVLTGIWKLLGNQTADDSLILIAAYRIGGVTQLDGSGRRSHPLLATMRRISHGGDTTRTVWYLHSQNGIDQPTYDYLIAFIALGVLAQHPNEFGLSVPPLAF